MLHNAGDDVPVPQKAHSLFHFAIFQKCAQMGRADGHAVQLHFPNDIAAKTERAALFRESFGVSETARAEMIIVPTDQMTRVKLADKIVLHKGLPVHVHHVPVKMAKDHVFDAVERLHQMLSLVHGVQKLRRRSEHERIRVRVEAHGRGNCAERFCPLAGFFQQRAMADVDPIEKSQRDNTSFVQAFVTSKKLLIVVRTVFSTLPKSKNSPVML